MSKRTIGIIILVILIITGLIYYFYSKSKIISVEKVALGENRVEKTISANGQIVSEFDASLSFGASGKISAIFVKEGDIVNRGAKLATLDSNTAFNSAQGLKDARDAILRDRDIYVDKYLNNQDDAGGSDQYKLQLRKYDEQISQAESNYRAQTSNIRNYSIYAPIDGTVYEVSKEFGEITSPTETVIKLANLDNLYFEAEIDQEDFGVLKESAKAKITLDAYPNDEFEAEIKMLPRYATTSSSDTYFKVKLNFNPKGMNVYLGMDGDTEIVVDTTTASVQTLIFDEVFRETDGRTFVWYLDADSKLKKQYIEIGLEGDLYTQIISDIRDLNIVRPSSTTQILEEGKTAKVIES